VLTLTDWQTSYRLLAIVLVVVMAPLGWLALKDNPAQVGAVLDDELLTRDATRSGAATATARQRFADDERQGATLRQALRSSAFWILSFGFIACGFTMAFANTHFMAFADDMGMGTMLAANVVAVTAVFSIGGAVALGLLADRWRRTFVLSIAYALRGGAFILLLLLPIGQLDFIYAIVLGFSWTATTPLAASIAGDLYGRANFGVIFGTMFTFMNVGFGLGAFLDGVMYDSMGHYRVALIANCVLGFAAAVATLLMRDRASRTVAHLPAVAPAAVAFAQRRPMSGD
jgi:MFS family permease